MKNSTKIVMANNNVLNQKLLMCFQTIHVHIPTKKVKKLKWENDTALILPKTKHVTIYQK